MNRQPRPWLEAYADNYRNDDVVHPHCHAQAQLIHGVSGVMVVSKLMPVEDTRQPFSSLDPL